MPADSTILIAYLIRTSFLDFLNINVAKLAEENNFILMKIYIDAGITCFTCRQIFIKP